MDDFDEYTIEDNSSFSNGEDDEIEIFEGDEIYLDLANVDEQLERRDLSPMERIRLERHRRFLEQRIEELELSRVQEEEQRTERIEQELESMARDLEISRRQLRINKIHNRFDDAIIRSKRGNFDMVSMVLSTLVRSLNEDIDIIETEDIQHGLRSNAVALLENINTNENLSFNVNQNRRYGDISRYMNQMFALLGVEGLSTEYQMDVSRDEEIARQLQEQFNRGRRF